MSDLQCPARLIVARHAEAAYESHDLVDQGGSLTPTGREQSRALGDSLRGERIAHVYDSSYSRAVQTGEIAAAALGVGVTVREGLLEVSVGDYAGLPSEPDPIRPIFAQWADGDLDARIPGAENGHEVISRLGDTLDEIADLHRGEAVLVISHGGVMCAALPALARNMRIRDIEGQHLANTAYARFERDGDGWLALEWPGLDL